MQETEEAWVRRLGWEDLLQEEMAIDSRILAGKIPWTEEPGGLQSMGLHRDSTVHLSTHTYTCIYRFLFIHSSLDERLGCFHLLTIVIGAAIRPSFLFFQLKI